VLGAWRLVHKFPGETDSGGSSFDRIFHLTLQTDTFAVSV
jgi:hypothetical protein